MYCRVANVRRLDWSELRLERATWAVALTKVMRVDCRVALYEGQEG